jgi:hypothetical protein
MFIERTVVWALFAAAGSYLVAAEDTSSLRKRGLTGTTPVRPAGTKPFTVN